MNERTFTTRYIDVVCSGLALVVIGCYIEWRSMDLARYDFVDYFRRDIAMPEWWAAIALPILLGLGYFAAGVIFRAKPRQKLKVSLACMLAGILCFPFNQLLAVVAVLFTSVIVFIEYCRKNET